MRVFIIEDEKPAFENLLYCIREIDNTIEIAGYASGVTESIRWLQTNPPPEIILMDIELADGISFNIFSQHKITSPVIFTTAYNKYLTEAFEYNSIDYLLKPIDTNKLRNTLDKYRNLQQHFTSNYSALLNVINNPKKVKSRILVKRGTEFLTLRTEDIVYFFTEHKLVFAVDKQNKKYLCDIANLGELEEMLDEKLFFRVNRKYIVNADYIVKFKSIDKSKICIDLQVLPSEEIIISQENAPVFKRWISEL